MFGTYVLILFWLFIPFSTRAEPLRLAFGSCARIDLPQPIWHTIAQWHPDVFVTLGDIIYADTHNLRQMRAMYGLMDHQAEFAAFRKTCPIVGIWDDHDFGENDGGASYAQREGAQALFLDFMKEPAGSVRRKTPGIYDAVFLDKGRRIQLIMLDTRFFRSDWVTDRVTPMRYRPVYDPKRTMLGEAQWQWLAEQLRLPADVRVIASGIQVVNDTHGYECWGLFPLERDRLFRAVRASEASGVLFITGDRHFAELSAMDGDLGYPVYDLTSSGLTHTAQDGHKAPNNKRIGEGYNGFNFGAITIDLEADVPRVLLEIRALDGSTAVKKEIPLADLKFQND